MATPVEQLRSAIQTNTRRRLFGAEVEGRFIQISALGFGQDPFWAWLEEIGFDQYEPFKRLFYSTSRKFSAMEDFLKKEYAAVDRGLGYWVWLEFNKPREEE